MDLGLDLGTSGVKALLLDGDRVIASATAPLEVRQPHPGWSEQHPEDWRAACIAAVRGLGADLSGVASIGLSGQMHGAVCLDAAGAVLRPAILWNDGRAGAEARALDGDPRFRAVSGNIVFAGFTAPKLAWMAAHEAGLRARVAMVLLPKDWLRLWLTGEAVSEPSDACGTAWFDTGARDWSDALLEATGMTRAQMPRLVEGSDVSGRLRPAAAAELGLPAGIPVAGGGGDNAATAVGAGVIAPGTGFISLGTSGVIFTASDRFQPAPETAVHSFCHALPGRWCHMGVTLAAGAALGWWAGVAGAPEAALLSELPPHPLPGRVRFRPWLSGERTPWNDSSLRAGFDGIAAGDQRAALTQAVLEGVAFAFAGSLDALRDAGSRPQALWAMGGGARSALWLQMLADLLGVPLLRARGAEHGGALGAARLGQLARTGATPESLPLPDIADRFDPDPARSEAWAEAKTAWTKAATQAAHPLS